MGTVCDIGTIFQIQVAAALVRIRVREGRVELRAPQTEVLTAARGRELEIERARPRAPPMLSPTHPAWAWAEALAVAPDIDCSPAAAIPRVGSAGNWPPALLSGTGVEALGTRSRFAREYPGPHPSPGTRSDAFDHGSGIRVVDGRDNCDPQETRLDRESTMLATALRLAARVSPACCCWTVCRRLRARARTFAACRSSRPSRLSSSAASSSLQQRARKAVDAHSNGAVSVSRRRAR